MNKQQYINKHRLSNIDQRELDRKWRVYQEQRELLEAQSFRAIAPSSSATSGGAGYQMVDSYVTIINTSWLYPLADYNYILEETSIPYTIEDNRVVFDNITDLYNFYEAVYFKTAESQPIGNVGYSLGVGTHLKSLEQEIHLELSSGLRIVTWSLCKQLTPQSDLPSGGNSPDDTIGYTPTYTDWTQDGEQDPLTLGPEDLENLGFEYADPLRVEKGPQVSILL